MLFLQQYYLYVNYLMNTEKGNTGLVKILIHKPPVPCPPTGLRRPVFQQPIMQSGHPRKPPFSRKPREKIGILLQKNNLMWKISGLRRWETVLRAALSLIFLTWIACYGWTDPRYPKSIASTNFFVAHVTLEKCELTEMPSYWGCIC